MPITLESALTGVDSLEDEEISKPTLGAPLLTPKKADQAIEIVDRDEARQGVMVGTQHNPDQRAKDETLAKKADLHPDMVQADRENIQRQVNMDEALRAIDGSPVLQRHMGSSDFAALSYDDADNLSWWEHTETGFARGRLLHELGRTGFRLQQTAAPEASTEVKAIREQMEALGERSESGFGSWLESAAEVIGQQIESIGSPEAAARVGGGGATGAALGAWGGPLAPATVSAGTLIGMGAGFLSHLAVDSFEVEGGLSYLEQLEIGIDPSVAKWTATGVGLVNAALEVASDTVLLAPIAKAGKKLLREGIRDAFKNPNVLQAAKEFGTMYGAGISAEVGTEVMQEVVNIIGEEIGKQFSVGDFESVTLEEASERLQAIATHTFKAMALLAAPGPGANFAIDVVQSKAAKTNQQIIQDIAVNAKESKLQERSPERYAEYINDTVIDTDNETVNISSDGLVELFQSNPEIVEEFREVIPDLDQKLAEAQLEGGDVEVATGDYAAYIATMEGAEGLASHVRLKEGDMTLAEAETFDAKQQEHLVEDYQKFQDEIETLEIEEDAGQAIFEDVQSQLTTAERTPQEAQTGAAIHQAFFTTMAERVNEGKAPEERVDAWQLYSGRKLSIQKAQRVGVAEREAVPAGAIIEAAPSPADVELAEAFDTLSDEQKIDATLSIGEAVIPEVLESLGISKYTTEYTSGGYQDRVNPSIIVNTPELSIDQMVEMGKVLGYATSQEAVIAFDEGDKKGKGLTTFARVVPTTSLRYTEQQELYKFLRERVPEVSGFTWRDDAMVLGNYSDLSDKKFYEAVRSAIAEHEGEFDLFKQRFRAELVPVSLEGTRYDDTRREKLEEGRPAVPGEERRGDIGSLERIRQTAGQALRDVIGERGAIPAERERPGEEPAVARRAVVDEDLGSGRETAGFFAGVTEGTEGTAIADAEYEPIIDTIGRSDVDEFTEAYTPFRGNFDTHIAYSIPGYLEVQEIVGNAIRQSYPEGTMLDVGASEGALAKGVASTSKVQVTALDPNLSMQETFNTKPQAEGATFVLEAFGNAEQEGDVAWTEDDGTEIKYFTPDTTYDVVHEAMVFQFMSPDRESQIARTKDLMNPDGVLIIEEKVLTEDEAAWQANEDKKNVYKAQFFDEESLSEKAESILVGMNENMRAPSAIESILGGNFSHVTQFWDSGNFRGYIASDSAEALETMVSNIGSTESEFSTIETPQVVQAERELFQKEDEGVVRGSIKFTAEGDTVISLFEKADRSTFIHETGHLFLDSFKAMAEVADAPQQLRDDWQTITEFLEIKPGEPVSVESDEKWARAFEAYLREGKAPTEGLQSVFRMYKRWLVRIYQSVSHLEVTINDDIRDVMDRMLASDQQIDQAEQRNQYYAASASVGVLQKDIKEIVQATEQAKEKLLTKLMKEITRETKEWWKNEKADLRVSVAEEFYEKQNYKVKIWLQTGKLPDGSELEIGATKLSLTDLKEMYGTEKDALWRRLPFGKNAVYAKEGGAHPDNVAGLFGYQSGDAMVQDIVATGNIEKDIDEATQARMLDIHGDMLNDGTIEQEAQDAVHNASRTQVMLEELKVMAKELGRDATPRRAVRQAAKQIIDTKQVKDIKPEQYLHAGRRMTDKMMTATRQGKREEALQYAHQRLLNHYLYMEGRDAKKRVDIMHRYMRRAQTKKYNPKLVDPVYISQIKLLANAYDFRKSTPAIAAQTKRNLAGLVRWVMGQQDKGVEIAIPELIDRNLARIATLIQNADDTGAPLEELMKSLPIKSYATMTIGELTDVYNMTRHLRHIGGKNSEQAREELAAEAQLLADTVTEHGGETIEQIDDKDWLDKAKDIIKRVSYDQVKLLSDIRQFDGYEDFGPLFNSIYQPIVDSTNSRIEMDLKAVEDMKEIFRSHEKQLKPKKDIRALVKENGETWSMSLRERVMLAVYWGSPESREAVLSGYAATEHDVQEMLNTLTDEQLNIVEQIWEYNEGHWPELSRIETEVNGVPPLKVEHVPFEVNGREMPGGYQRIYYHWHQKDKFKIDMHDEANKAMHMNTVTMSKTGATIARTGAGGRKIRLDTDNVFRATEDTLQFVAFAEASRQVARISQHPALSGAIIDKYGRERYQSFIDSIDAIFAGNAVSGHVINSMLRGVRTNLTFGYLALSIRNMVQQPVALTNVMGRIGEVETLRAMALLARNPVKWSRFVQERSVFMTRRNRFINREAAEQLARIQSASGLGFRPAWGFVLQTIGDAIVTYPAWLAAYDQGRTRFSVPGRPEAEVEKMAITWADEMVASTVGSGLTKDLPPLFQGTGSLAQAVGPEAAKQLTFMGSFFNMTYNLYFEAWQRADFKSPGSALNFVREMAWYAVVPGILSAWVVGEGPDEEDDEGFWGWAAKATAEYGFSASMFWRNMVSAIKGFEPNIPAFKVFTGTTQAGKTITAVATDDEEELGKEEMAKLIRSFEPLLALPGAGQAARTLEYLDSYEQGEEGEFSLQNMLVKGKERD